MINNRKLRVVLDSVIVVSAFLTDGLTAKLVYQCQQNADLYTAEDILQEIRRVLLEKPHIRNRYNYSSEEVELFINYLRNISTVVGHLPEIRVIERDPKDDMIIACAVAVSANYIVSRDQHLLGPWKLSANTNRVPRRIYSHFEVMVLVSLIWRNQRQSAILTTSCSE